MSGSAPSAGPSKGWRRSPAAQQQHPSSAQVAPAPGDEMTQPAPAVAAKFKSNRLAELKRSSTLGAPAAAAAAASGSLQDLKVQKEQQRPSSSSAASRSQEASRNQLLLLAQNQHVQQEQQQCQVPGPGHHPQAMQFSTMQLDYGANQAPLHIQGPVYSHQNQHHTSASIQPQHALQQYQNQHQHQHQSTSQMSKGHTTDSSSLALSSEQCTDGEHEDRPSCVQIMKKLFFSLVLGIVIAICWVMIIHTLKWIAIRGNEYELVNQQQQSPLHHHRSSAGVQSLAALGAPPNSALSSSPSDVFQRRRAAQDEPSALDQVAGSSAAGTGDPTSGAEINLQVAAAGERVTRQSSENDNGSDNDDNGESYESVRRPAELAKQSASGGENSGMSRGAARGQQVARPSQASGRLGARPQLQLQPISTRQSFADGGRVTALNNRQRPPSSPAAAGSGPLPPLMVLDFGANNQEESLKSETSVEPASKQVSFASTGLEPSLEGSPEDEGLAAGGVPGSSLSLESRGLAPVAGLVYRAPFFTSWFVSIWNILFMPVFTLISSCCFRNEDSTTKKLLVESINQFMDNGLTTLQFLGRCAFFSVLWIGTIFGIVYSLSNIDATVVMALFACSVALVYLLSWVLLHQQFVGVRIVAVIICTTGIALLAYMDNSRTLGSVLIVAGSALCSAVYKVIYQRMFGFWSIAQMSLFFTLIGLFNAFLMWPVALMLYFLGAELIVWRYIPWMHLTAAGALHLTANIIAYFGPICSYDIFLTMGLLVAVVLSAVIDVTFYKITFFGMKLAGVLLLMVGFLVCLLPENWNEFLYDLVNERFVRWKKQRNLKKSRNKVQDLSTGQMSRLRTPSGRVK